MDWTEKKREEASDELEKWAFITKDVDASSVPPIEVVDALSDDLNTYEAITQLRLLAKQDRMADLLAGIQFLGLTLPAVDEGMGRAFDWLLKGEEVGPLIKTLIGRLVAARKEKNFTEADRIRDSFKSAGVTLSFDKDGGVTYKRGPDFDPTKLEALK